MNYAAAVIKQLSPDVGLLNPNSNPNTMATVSEVKSTSYLLVGHFKELEGRLLQGVGRLFDVLSCFRVLVGQNLTDLDDLLLQLGALQEDQAELL